MSSTWERGTGVIAGEDLGGRSWELLICGVVRNLGLQMTPDDDVSRKGGSSGMKRNLLGWKCCRGVMKLREDLERWRLLNELDDVVDLNGMNGCSDTCRHLDEWSIFDYYNMNDQSIKKFQQMCKSANTNNSPNISH